MKTNETITAASEQLKIYAIAAGACLLMTGAAYFFGIEPAMAAREKTLADRAEFESRVGKVADLSRTLQGTRRQLEDTRREIAGLPLKLEPASFVNHRLARIAELAGESGLMLEEVQPSTPTDGAYYQTVPIRLAGTGTYPSCAEFLHGLRARFPDMSVKAFECTSNGARNDRDTPANFRAEVSWFTTLPRK